MFLHLLYIHLFRPFLKYNPSTSPLPSHVSPRKLCSQAAGSVSKLMRLYKRTYGLRQICNIAVYIVHSACTIHLLNLPEKTAKRDIIHGVKHLEEIAEDWLCARRTLSILSVLARKWKIDLPEEAATVFARTDSKFGYFSTADVPSPKQELVVATPPSTATSPPRVSQPQPVPQGQPRSQNQLQQSLYSYLPDRKSMVMNTAMSGMARPPSNSIHANQTNREQVSSDVGSMSMSNEPLLSSVPYTLYNNPSGTLPSSTMTPSSGPPRNNSGVTSEGSGVATRQVSPNTMFGGVDALVESQDWWLRDQANLYGNWMGSGNNGDLNPNGVSGLDINGNCNDNGGLRTSLDSMAGIGSGIGSGYYIPPSNGNRGGDGYGDDEWNYS